MKIAFWNILYRSRKSLPKSSVSRSKTHKLVRLLDSWLADESGYDERVWPRLKKSIEENRLSSRRRFDE